MDAVDFITLLGRVLHDGKLRDAFAADRATFMRQHALREGDRELFLRLISSELEAQARVLLRKRFELVRGVLPQTCGSLGDAAWTEFAHYGRSNAPAGNGGAQIAADAVGFSEYLRTHSSAALNLVEHNRARFAHGHRRFAFHVVSVTPPNRTRRPAIQLLVRSRAARWRELLFFVAA